MSAIVEAPSKHTGKFGGVVSHERPSVDTGEEAARWKALDRIVGNTLSACLSDGRHYTVRVRRYQREPDPIDRTGYEYKAVIWVALVNMYDAAVGELVMPEAFPSTQREDFITADARRFRRNLAAWERVT